MASARNEVRGSDDSDIEYRRAIGRRLRALREKAGWSLREAGERSGLSHSFIRMVERGESEIAVSRLLKLAEAYGVFAADVLTDTKTHKAELVLADHPYAVPSATDQVHVAFLSSPSWGLQPFKISLVPGAGMSDLRHHGDEFMHLLEGVAVVRIDGVDYELHPGDTVAVPEYSDHAYHNVGATRAVFLGAVNRDDARDGRDAPSSDASPEASTS